MIVNIISTAKASIGIYISGEYIKSVIFGAWRFWSITFSIPLPIETTKNIWGVTPINVAKKKLNGFTLKMQGSTLDITNGIPPINL